MSHLRTMLIDLGFQHSTSLLQSGNLVFTASSQAVAPVASQLEHEIQKRFEVAVQVIVRSATEWRLIVSVNPFVEQAAEDPSRLLIVCFKSEPDESAMARLRSAIVGREQLECVGRQLYVVYPDGIGRSRLTHTRIEKSLGIRGTARNWNTALKIAALLSS